MLIYLTHYVRKELGSLASFIALYFGVVITLVTS
jgi:hypothetical protein